MHSPNWPTRPSLALPAIAAGAALVAYANSLGGVFQFDDFNVIVDSDRVHSWPSWLHATLSGGLRPLLNLSYTFDWILGGGEPLAFHFFNLSVHLATVFVIYRLAGHFVQRCLPDGDWRPPALWTALLFAVHPVHTEAITYISGRSASLMTLLYLAAMLLYVKADGGRHARRLASCALFAAALAVKETAILFPLALLIWEWTLKTPWREIARRQWLFWFLWLSATVLLTAHPATWTLLSNSIELRQLHASLPTQIAGATGLLSRLAWPAALNIDPDWPIRLGLDEVVPQASLWIAALAGALMLRLSRPWVGLAVFWAFAHLLLPNALFPRVDVANERQLYLVDWPLLLAFVIELTRHLRRTLAFAMLSMICLLLAFITIDRNSEYVSQIALWEDTASHSPGKARVFNNLGYAYQLAGRLAEAEAAYRKSLELDPGSIKAANNLQRLQALPPTACDRSCVPPASPAPPPALPAGRPR